MIDHNIQLAKGSLLQNGTFRIEKVLGQGGFGITYLATQEILERKVCIKEFFMRDFCSRSESDSSVTLGTSANKELMERYLAKFVKEARTISQLEHPNIIHIHDIFKENGTAYYVMDYIEGESLSNLVKRRGALPEEEAVTYIRAVAEALKYVHARSINHLDVKPGNIMVRASDHNVFLLDFGLSKQYDAAGYQTSSTPLGISHGYAPIEQYSPEGIKTFSPQTDIYSLGATLYYLVTGLTPPSASELSDTELIFKNISIPIRNAIQQAMNFQRKNRPQDINAFLALLIGIEQGEDGNRTKGLSPNESDLEDTMINQIEIPSSISERHLYEEKQFLEKRVTEKGGSYKSWIIGVGLIFIITYGIRYLYFNRNMKSDVYKIETDTIKKIREESIAKIQESIARSQKREDCQKDEYGICRAKEVDLVLSVIWAGWNVGAYKPEEYGGLFQPSSYTNTGWDGWRLPTSAELEEIQNYCKWTWINYRNTDGVKVVGPNGNAIFLPAAGIRNNENVIEQRNLYGGYWSSDWSNSTTGGAYYMDFDDFEGRVDEDGYPLMAYGYFRYCDKSVRLVRDK